MNSQIQKKPLHILTKSKQAKMKDGWSEESIFQSFLQFRTEQRANYHKEVREQQIKQRKEFERLCQSLQKQDMSYHHSKKRQSKSLHSTPKVHFQTPIQNKTHRKFLKTPFPKQ